MDVVRGAVCIYTARCLLREALSLFFPRIQNNLFPSPRLQISSRLQKAVMASSSRPHPDSYAAYAFTKKGGKLEKLTLPWKDPQQGEIVVKVLACGVCGR